jgi:hypothetical protein
MEDLELQPFDRLPGVLEPFHFVSVARHLRAGTDLHQREHGPENGIEETVPPAGDVHARVEPLIVSRALVPARIELRREGPDLEEDRLRASGLLQDVGRLLEELQGGDDPVVVEVTPVPHVETLVRRHLLGPGER